MAGIKGVSLHRLLHMETFNNKHFVYYRMSKFPLVGRSLAQRLEEAVERSPDGIASLDVLESLNLCSREVLKVTLSRLGKAGRILRLKRGRYSANPARDAFACAQAVFNGYLGFASALYLHGLISEMPFSLTVVTVKQSGTRKMGEFEFAAVALKEKAVGFGLLKGRLVSSRAKTLFDCLYLPRYSVGKEKLVLAFGQAGLSEKEWREFEGYVAAFSKGKKAVAMLDFGNRIRAGKG